MSIEYDFGKVNTIFNFINEIKKETISFRYAEEWGDIFSFSMLLSFICNSGLNGNLILEFINDDVRNFFVRMGIKNFVKVKYDDKRTYHDSTGRFIEFKSFTSEDDVDTGVKEVCEILKKANLSKADVNAMVFITQELMDNVIRHSKSDKGGLICGMVYPKKKFIEFSIVDCGIGFRGSLAKRKEFENISEFEAMETAALKRDREGTGDLLRGGGNGIPYSWELIKKAKGELIIFSGNVKFHNGKIEKFSYKWDGVAIRFAFPLGSLKCDTIESIFGYSDIGFPDDECLFEV